jgi:hypothetical protein
MALGTLIIQNKKNLSDRETVAEITENPWSAMGSPDTVKRS